ncbi:MAG: HlyD family efflux transporter periplasmic adaptor subunit [Desulfuromonadales bacterium]|nr:HlyD family efflux transporter periplasmic adaptor subunit [Desulfuromonadales bacterium]
MKSSRFGLVLIAVMFVAAIILALTGPSLFDNSKDLTNHVRQAMPQPSQAAFAAKGTVESIQEIDLSSRVKGEISAITIEEGDRVSPGQMLVRMNSSKIEAQIEIAEANLRASKALLEEQSTGFRREDIAAAQSAVERARVVYEQAALEAERQQRLLEKGAISRFDWEKAEEKRRIALAQLNELGAQRDKYQKGSRTESIAQAQARVAEATAELKYYRAILADYSISSPMDGLVIRRHKDADESVDVGTPLLTIIDPAHLRIHAEVEETDVGRITEGQSIEVTVDARSNKVYTGKVYKVFPTVSKKTQRTFDPMASFDINTQKIYIALDDFSGLVQGMTVTVRFLK